MNWYDDLKPQDHELMESKDIQYKFRDWPIKDYTVGFMRYLLNTPDLFWAYLKRRI